MAKINSNCIESHQLAGPNILSIKFISASNAILHVVLLLGMICFRYDFVHSDTLSLAQWGMWLEIARQAILMYTCYLNTCSLCILCISILLQAVTLAIIYQSIICFPVFTPLPPSWRGTVVTLDRPSVCPSLYTYCLCDNL